MNYKRLAGLGFAITALFASSCGSSGSTDKTQPTQSTQTGSETQAGATTPAQSARLVHPLTKAELIVRADAICRRVNAKRASVVIKTERDFTRLLPRLAAYEQAAIAQMRKLTPPPSMATSWNLIVEGDQLTEEAAVFRSRYVHGSAANPDAQGPLSPASANIVQKSLILAKSEGFKDCSRP